MAEPAPATPPLLSLRGVDKRFDQPPDLATRIAGWLGARRPPSVVHAVTGVDLDVQAGEVLGVVGESGCGKSTLGRVIADISPPSAGEVRYQGQPLPQMTGPQRRAYELGRRLYEQGDTEGALRAYRELLRTRREFADVHYRVATLLERLGDLESASQHLHEALHQNPAYIEALLALASLYERKGDFDRSRDLARRAGELAGPAHGRVDPTTRAKLANSAFDAVLVKPVDWDEAARLLRDAIRAHAHP